MSREAGLLEQSFDYAVRATSIFSIEVASTEAKQSSGGRGTTEYENSLAPRGASRHCNRVCAYYQRLLILFTCPIHMAVGDS
jgi:hypothetical protein